MLLCVEERILKVIINMIKMRFVFVIIRNVNWWIFSGYLINKFIIFDNINMKKIWKIIKLNVGYIL